MAGLRRTGHLEAVLAELREMAAEDVKQGIRCTQCDSDFCQIIFSSPCDIDVVVSSDFGIEHFMTRVPFVQILSLCALAAEILKATVAWNGGPPLQPGNRLLDRLPRLIFFLVNATKPKPSQTNTNAASIPWSEDWKYVMGCRDVVEQGMAGLLGPEGRGVPAGALADRLQVLPA